MREASVHEPLLVFFHALPFDGGMWDDVAPRLGRTWIAPELRAGGSVRSWAEAALASTGDVPLVVIGESIGGSAAVEVARARPDLVEGIVMIGAKAGVNRDLGARDRAVDRITEHGVAAAWESIWEPMLGPTASAAHRELARRAAVARPAARVIDGVLAFHERRDDAEFLDRWTGPLVGISGEHDEAPSPTLVRELATGPNRTFHLVAECGHYVHLEQPDRLIALLRDWIER